MRCNLSKVTNNWTLKAASLLPDALFPLVISHTTTGERSQKEKPNSVWCLCGREQELKSPRVRNRVGRMLPLNARGQRYSIASLALLGTSLHSRGAPNKVATLMSHTHATKTPTPFLEVSNQLRHRGGASKLQLRERIARHKR